MGRALDESAPSRAPKRRCGSRRVVLQVGAARFETSMDTLRSHTGSYFDSLVSGRFPVDEQDDGSIFVDRKPDHFECILDYLRNGRRFVAPTDTKDRDALRLEAEFYGLAELASMLRRFSLADTHFITEAVSTSEQGKERVKLRGLRHAAAAFDVQDPDCFEASFDISLCEVCLALPKNTPVCFVGLVPEGSCLSAPWQSAATPLPDHERSPFQDGLFNWNAIGRHNPRPVDRGDCAWPATCQVPAALSDGLFLAFTDLVVGEWNESENLAGFLCQSVVRGKFDRAADLSTWSTRPLSFCDMSFTRAEDGAEVIFSVYDDSDGLVMRQVFKLQNLCLDVHQPYRPAIFLGSKCTAVVTNEFEQ
mmetsp:Transcript_6089/g.11135  ORF Transcript_6089/g.11135 Transcript_6089/m.11135 type:complete len:363 (-) Transcript_6089:47-1135(-)